MPSETASQRGFVEVNGARLYYEVAGAGPVVALSHAGIADQRMWDDQFATLAQRYRVIRYDHRGFGQSTLPPGDYTLYDDLHGLLRFLAVERAALVGVSMGGSAILDFALAYPQMVSALVTVGAGVSGFDFNAAATPDEVALEEQIEQAAAAGDFARANDLEAHMWVDGLHRAPEMVNPSVRERVLEMNLPGFLRDDDDQATRRELDPPANKRLGEISAPTLVIVGDQDVQSIQVVADRLATGIPGARKVVMRDTAHVPNMEQPAEFNRLLLDFGAQTW